jgi:hypothetical protein
MISRASVADDADFNLLWDIFVYDRSSRRFTHQPLTQ